MIKPDPGFTPGLSAFLDSALPVLRPHLLRSAHMPQPKPLTAGQSLESGISPVLQARNPSIPEAMAAPQLFRAFVSAQWVAEALKSPRASQALKLLDASWYLPKLGRNARQEFEERHIPGATFFDIDHCSDHTSPYDHMLPSAADFADYAGSLGVGATTHVVVYDGSDQGLYSAPRVWWMFRAFGHRSVSLLDGGLRYWLSQKLPISSGKSHPEPAEFRAQLDPSFIKTHKDLLENLEARRFQVVDARAAGRFRGTEPEPRDGNTLGKPAEQGVGTGWCAPLHGLALCWPFKAHRAGGEGLVAGRLILSLLLPSYSGGHSSTSWFRNSEHRLPKYLENPGRPCRSMTVQTALQYRACVRPPHDSRR